MHVGTDWIPTDSMQNQLERIVASPLHMDEVAGADSRGAVPQTSDPTNPSDTPVNQGTPHPLPAQVPIPQVMQQISLVVISMPLC